MSNQSLPRQFLDNTVVKTGFLGVLSSLLSLTFPLSLFASIPLAISSLLFGVKTGLLSIISGSVFVIVLTVVKPDLAVVAGTSFLLAVIVASVNSQILLKKIHPLRGIVQASLIISLMLAVMFVLAPRLLHFSWNTLLEQHLTTALDEAKKQSPEAFSKMEQMDSKDLTSLIIKMGPRAIFISVVFHLWIGLGLLLRNRNVWKIAHAYPFSSRDLVQFRVPEKYLYLAIASLTVYVAGIYLPNESLEFVGGNLIYCVGLFYFFHGLAVFLDFLKFMKIFGFFRMMFVIATIFFLYRFLALVGLFDLWVDFRKYFKNKKIEGDNK